MDFQNIRINPYSQAPLEYIEYGSTYFPNEDLQSLYEYSQRLNAAFAPNRLPQAILLHSVHNVDEQFQQPGLQGKYIKSEEICTIHIVRLSLDPYARGVFWHEYGHHIWETLNLSILAEWRELYSFIQTTASFKEAQLLDLLLGGEYWTLPKELWARLFSQYILLQLLDREAAQMLAKEPEGLWTERDIEKCTPFISTILHRCGFIVSAPA